MIQVVKHFAFRVWATLLLGGLLSLTLLSVWQSVMGLEWLIVPVAAVFGLMFFLIGWLSSRVGISQIEHLRDEAAVWERAGLPDEAQAVYQKALAVYDSFLLSPRSKKKSAIALIAQMARFYLARAIKNDDTEAFILTYLEAHPEDSEFAENWLQQIDSRHLVDKKYQDVADGIGSALPDNIQVQQLLAKLYLSARRTDFPAQQVYRRALSGEGAAADSIMELAAIFMDEGRADERALDIYLKAFQIDSHNEQIIKSIAACVRWVPQTEKTADLLQKARQLLDGISEIKLPKMPAGFVPSPRPAPPRKERMALNPLKAAGSLLYRFINTLLVAVRFLGRGGIKTVFWLIDIVQTSRKTRILLKWSVVGVFAVAIIVLMVNTIGHFIKTAMGDRQQKRAAVSAVTDPYTLQVAAYLKPEHAKAYVATLKKMNIDAYWTEAVGNNKNWFQVRVSHFPDKKSAVAYGETLKSKGIINDFFVANY
ncbi:MAG: SPOR domain-containing protein [Desulfobacterales bacterium]|nr:SPOR domain-containing protein [Desulfobacterales bacterium]